MSDNPTAAMTDTEVESRLRKLKRTIKTWCEKHGLWNDRSFTTWARYFDDEPGEEPCVLVLTTESGIFSTYEDEYRGELEEEFCKVIWGLGFHYEEWDHCTALFYAEDEPLKEACKRYFEWKWICGLIEPDFTDLYEEIFAHVATDSDKLYNLTPRKFEMFLDAVFRNNGYHTELGPGQGDGGVDLRLYQKDAIDNIVTLVQAKRYAGKNPIRVEAVQAFSAVVEDEKANRGLFVTTSRYLPSAKDFAARQNHRITLATSADVAKWSELAATRIIRDKSQLVTDEAILGLVPNFKTDGTDPRIVCASWGYTMILVDFCIVLRETAGAALLMEIPSKDVSGDGQVGTVVPVVDETITKCRTADRVFRARRKKDWKGLPCYWAKTRMYRQWDGKPVYFNSLD